MPIGDDDRRDCETTLKLEHEIAELFGKEAAMLAPSGIMANNLALMVMAPDPGAGVVLGSKSHIIMNERAAIATVARAMPWIIKNEDDGTMPLD